MAKNLIYGDTPTKRRTRAIGEVLYPSTAPTALVSGKPYVTKDNRSAVAYTSSPEAQVSTTVGGYTTTGPAGGVGNAPGKAVFSFDGSWELAVTDAATNTASDVQVYIVKATGVLTLTADGSNTATFGFTDYPPTYVKTAGVAVVRIGA